MSDAEPTTDGAPPPVRCTCGDALREWQYSDPGGKLRSVWAESLADVVDYQGRKPTRHDILDGRGRRLLRGQCEVVLQGNGWQ